MLSSYQTLLVWKKEWSGNTLTFYQLSSEGADLSVKFCVAVLEDLSYTVSFQGKIVDLQNEIELFLRTSLQV